MEAGATLAGWILAALLIVWSVLLLLYRQALSRLWREPALKAPCLIIESDDWGPGPPHHAEALRQIAACLRRHRDSAGRPAMMTLGVVLSVPDAVAIAANDAREYVAKWLDHADFEPHLDAIRQGREQGVFAPQLHGAAHYWPPALMRAARQQPEVRAWLTTPASLETERLPSPLQARWTDAAHLPSTPLEASAIRDAITEEVAAYRRVLGEAPRVAVPPTFVWNREVELAWAAAGITCVITPGHRHDARDASGRPSGASGSLVNGDTGAAGITYLVRDDYFEPAFGHTAERALAALAAKTAQGRPCLLETHRFNFTGEHAEAALRELDRMLALATQRFPNLRFIASAQLAEHYRHQDDGLHRDWRPRYQAWLARIRVLPRFWKLATLTGLGWLLTRPTSPTAAAG